MTKAMAKAAGEPNQAARLADEEQTAEYIGDLVFQLERLARSQGLVQLQYLLGACREEAQKISGAGGVRD
ncbi:MAG: hypothetical protein A3E78_11500 [Alphaproteobacteria bacterium RIFCSPHIGHO2_12_FULL_63_12]|nr:MAG: hypothetical protein A3E78_11500 [Alphaproteobacteria bacterium RIFCSPHIGHO2_12_FULL_63_12]